MQNLKLEDIEAMLVVLYKKLDKIEREAKGSWRSAPDSTYLRELRNAAVKVKESLEKETPR